MPGSPCLSKNKANQVCGSFFLVVKRRVASASWLDHQTLVDSRPVKCNFSSCSTSNTVKSCGVLVNSAGCRLSCRSGPPVDRPKDPWLRVLSLPGRFVGDPASLACDNAVYEMFTLESYIAVYIGIKCKAKW